MQQAIELEIQATLDRIEVKDVHSAPVMLFQLSAGDREEHLNIVMDRAMR